MKKSLPAIVFATLFAVLPSIGFAAMTRFPVSREDILRHVLENTDAVQIGTWISRTGDAFDPLGGRFFDYRTHFKNDGTAESINALARRSVDEFERFLVAKMRDAVSVTIDRADTSLVGVMCKVDYTLWKDLRSFHPWLPSTMIFIEQFEKVLALGSDGKVVIPDTLFAVDLQAQVVDNRTGHIGFFVSGILEGTLTVEDEQGRVSETLPLFVKSDVDILAIHVSYLNEHRRGKLTLRYRGGTEQTFNRWDGKLLETTLPDLRPITGIQLLYDTVVLTVAAKPEDDLRVDFSSLLGRWEEQSNPALTKSGAEERVFSLPEQGPVGFFQVRAVPSTIKIR